MIHIRGKVYIATDSNEYFISILYDIYKTKFFYWVNDKGKKWEYSYLKIPETKYFKKSLKNGRKAMFIELSKI